MAVEQCGSARVGAAKAPGNKSDAGTKLMRPHVLEQRIIVQAAVILAEQRIVNNETGLRNFVAPGAITEEMAQAGEPGGDCGNAAEGRGVTRRGSIDVRRFVISEQN